MLRIELLSREHDREGFSGGERDLDDFLKRTARQHNEKGIPRTIVLVDSDEPVKILGFFTLSSCEVVAAELPPEYAKKYPRKAPAAKLARLAVARDLQRQGFGGLMMVDAMRRTLAVSENIGTMPLPNSSLRKEVILRFPLLRTEYVLCRAVVHFSITETGTLFRYH